MKVTLLLSNLDLLLNCFDAGVDEHGENENKFLIFCNAEEPSYILDISM